LRLQHLLLLLPLLLSCPQKHLLQAYQLLLGQLQPLLLLLLPGQSLKQFQGWQKDSWTRQCSRPYPA
jgi:hypothetical protein